MDDEQGPWWTRAPEPSRPDSGTVDQAEPGDPAPAEAFWPPPPPPPPPSSASAGPGTAAPVSITTEASGPPSAGSVGPSFTGSDVPAPAPAPPLAPELFPPLPEPAIRRVGVVPDPPAPRADPDPVLEAPAAPPRPRYTVNPDAVAAASSSARTETMPALPDDIFATFSGPDPTPTLRQAPDAPPAPGADPLAHLRADTEQHRRSPDARTLLIGAAGVVVVGLIALLAVISSGGTGTTADRPTSTGAPSGGRASSAAAVLSFGGTPPKDLTKLGTGAAADLLAKAGQAGSGSVNEAWSWNDDNGKNLVVTLVKPGNNKRHHTLQVIHLGHLEKSRPTVLRLMNDPDLPNCRTGGVAEFDSSGLLVRDLDKDGVAEIAAGWSSRCGTQKASEVKLALITGKKKFIIRGKGAIGGTTGTNVPDPQGAGWPPGYLAALQKVFHKLYY